MRSLRRTPYSPAPYPNTPIYVVTFGTVSKRGAFMDPLLAAPEVSNPVGPARSGIQIYMVDAPTAPGEEMGQ
jgi:hypothetical protein